MRIFFCAKKTKITIYSTTLLPQVTSSSILESITTHTHAFPLSWIWLPLTTSLAPHYNTLQMDCISHHALHSHIPIHHYTNHTAVTNHSFVLIVLPHLHLIHTHTFKQHTSMKTLQGLVLAPADISERYSSCYLLSLCLTRTARPWNSEPVPVTPTSAWYCLRLCPASDIPVFARWPLPVWFCLLN